MCIHRILRAEFGESLIISYEPNGHHLPSTGELMRVAVGLPAPANQFEFQPSRLPNINKKQDDLWCNRRVMSRIPAERRSPQSGSTLPKGTPEDDHDGSGPRYRGCSYRNAGRKPRNKHHRLHATAW